MTPRLYHISEEKDIQKFIPRISKEQWNYEKYVWAIAEEKLHNYLLPRECPRICIGSENSNDLINWLNQEKLECKKAMIFVPVEWEDRIQNCTLFKYEFDNQNFKLIDKIAGYYVSGKNEIPKGKTEIKNCMQELHKLNIELMIADKREIIETCFRHLREIGLGRPGFIGFDFETGCCKAIFGHVYP